MADKLSKAERSVVMAAIRSSGNKATELKLLALFKLYGITGWRRNQRVFGKPDFVFYSRRLAVFVDGCFWHGCQLHCRMPKTRRDFWIPKISRNRERDRKVNKILRQQGWTVIRVWEHGFRNPSRIAIRINAALAIAVE